MGFVHNFCSDITPDCHRDLACGKIWLQEILQKVSIFDQFFALAGIYHFGQNIQPRQPWRNSCKTSPS
jgi:hypothetical protein